MLLIQTTVIGPVNDRFESFATVVNDADLALFLL